MTTLQEIENALDHGALFASMTGGKWWLARRNGKTKLWKREPARFRIPFKVGFKQQDSLTERDLPKFDEGGAFKICYNRI